MTNVHSVLPRTVVALPTSAQYLQGHIGTISHRKHRKQVDQLYFLLSLYRFFLVDRNAVPATLTSGRSGTSSGNGKPLLDSRRQRMQHILLRVFFFSVNSNNSKILPLRKKSLFNMQTSLPKCPLRFYGYQCAECSGYQGIS